MLIYGKLYRPKRLHRLIRAPRTAYPSHLRLAKPSSPVAHNMVIGMRDVVSTPVIATEYHSESHESQ